MHRRHFLAVAGLAAMKPSLRSAAPDEKFDDIARLVELKMKEHHVPGVALGIFKNSEMTTRGFGVTNTDDPKPVTPDTVFTIASISKTFTATALVRLEQQGKVELKAPVRRYLTDFRVQDDAASRDVTVLHLLTHTPGWEGQLTGEDRGAHRDCLLLGAALALEVAGMAKDLREGAERAAAAIDSGASARLLDSLAAFGATSSGVTA